MANHFCLLPLSRRVCPKLAFDPEGYWITSSTMRKIRIPFGISWSKSVSIDEGPLRLHVVLTLMWFSFEVGVLHG